MGELALAQPQALEAVPTFTQRGPNVILINTN